MICVSAYGLRNPREDQPKDTIFGLLCLGVATLICVSAYCLILPPSSGNELTAWKGTTQSSLLLFLLCIII